VLGEKVGNADGAVDGKFVGGTLGEVEGNSDEVGSADGESEGKTVGAGDG